MLRYVTTNSGKVREARAYLDGVEQLDYDYTEVQASALGPIAATGAREAYRHAGEPVLVDDSGLFIDGFEGFPGPYTAYVEDTLGIETVQRLAASELDAPQRAAFRCVLAYCDGDEFAATPDPVDREDRSAAAAAGVEGVDEDRVASAADDALPVKLFYGSVRGRLVEPRGDGGFGYDPIFEHDGRTLAEMRSNEKNAISHRGRALAKFAEWFEARSVGE
ncbi:non-canonical purine NTP pyrophosphatase [Halobellus salinus]|uniref:Non-canonical purine NTP pyrophosphatase n=1 Tax=Halobellus salinus TaxID=931585 RepID=A0A830ED91_9EURY|nr:non-canonical purine NTP pyrophosphatase [Halobellus salinus]GGI93902.1 non-canonical purine NTP pyrophosphatase [Halobellus salinus]SMP19145.1 dITPase [Halobellus salinus]